MLGIAMGLPAALCVNAVRCGRNLAVEHNGDVYSCDHYVYPEYRLGNVHHGSISHMIDGRRQSLFGLYKSNSLPRQCRRCEYLAYCRGGCPKERTARTVDGEEGLNRLCDGYRRFFRHTDAHFRAMATCLRRGLPAARYHEFIDTSRGAGYPSSQVAGRRPGRNEPCTCGSGRKYKHCCGRARPH